MTTSDDEFALFDAPATKGKTTGGPVYQGVNRQIRALFPDSSAPAYLERAGIVAAARSLAASIDRAAAPPRPASGHQLALMHGQLLSHLEALAPEAGDAPDEFAQLVAQLTAK